MWEEYKTHPRILELRIICYFQLMVREYNLNKAMELYKTLAFVLDIDFEKLNRILRKSVAIRKKTKASILRTRQEQAFMGYLYGESRTFLAQDLMNISTATLYRRAGELRVENFVDDEWLEGLNDNVVICGAPLFALEATRFVKEFDRYLEVFGHVLVPKKEL